MSQRRLIYHILICGRRFTVHNPAAVSEGKLAVRNQLPHSGLRLGLLLAPPPRKERDFDVGKSAIRIFLKKRGNTAA